MKVLSIIDSFKSCASSEELNQAVLSDLPAAIWTEKINVPIADGGEGTMAAIYAALDGEWITVKTQDPLGKELEADYLLTTIDGNKAAIIESAAFIGIHLNKPSDEAVRQASSYGLGLVIKDALARKVDQIYVSLGGSGTSDGGLGLLAALGADLKPSDKGNPLLAAESLSLSSLDEGLREVQLFALADVTNPYTGDKGFAKIFAPQKGASEETVVELEKQAKKIAKQIQKDYQLELDKVSGAGAAGGLGGAIKLLDGAIVPGFPTIQEMIGLDELLKGADLVFTGEGQMDAQTEQGKVPFGVAKAAAEKNIPVIGLCGSRQTALGELEQLMLGVFSIQQGPISLEEAMEKTRTLKNIRLLAADLSRVFNKQ